MSDPHSFNWNSTPIQLILHLGVGKIWMGWKPHGRIRHLAMHVLNKIGGFNWDMIAGYEGTVYTPLTQSKEETTAVGTLHLLDNDAKHGHLQSTLQSTPHDSHCSARVQLSAHSDSSSPRLTPSPSPRANPSPLLERLLHYLTATIDGCEHSIDRCETRLQADVRGSAYTSGGQLDDSDSERNITSMVVRVEERPVCFSKDHPIPISQATSVAMGNTTTKTNTEIEIVSETGDGIRLGPLKHGPVAVGERTVISVRRRVTEQDVMWTDLVSDAVKETVADFSEMRTGGLDPYVQRQLLMHMLVQTQWTDIYGFLPGLYLEPARKGHISAHERKARKLSRNLQTLTISAKSRYRLFQSIPDHRQSRSLSKDESSKAVRGHTVKGQVCPTWGWNSDYVLLVVVILKGRRGVSRIGFEQQQLRAINFSGRVLDMHGMKGPSPRQSDRTCKLDETVGDWDSDKLIEFRLHDDSMHTWNVGIWDKRCGAEGDRAPEMRVCVDGVCHILQDPRMHSQGARACLNGAAFSRMREDWRWDAGFEEYRGRSETRRDEGKGQSGK
ncbi:hypothetical protein BU17DRAFT_60423 [Hysterangium stoloniferum]|nr:hypothetical protein BU17DRAFT_60423 [Hysterangium stoloniferum]